jgi:hypothetical protein
LARFLSQQWVDEFNGALSGRPIAIEEASVSAEGGNFSVGQLVRDAPADASASGEVRTLLVVADHVLHLELVEGDFAATPDVTISLGWEDAVALSTGTLDVAEALGRGRIRVRGDLSVLVAGQAAVAAAAPLLADLGSRTSY